MGTAIIRITKADVIETSMCIAGDNAAGVLQQGAQACPGVRKAQSPSPPKP